MYGRLATVVDGDQKALIGLVNRVFTNGPED